MTSLPAHRFQLFALLFALFLTACPPQYTDHLCDDDRDCFEDEECVEAGVCVLRDAGGDAGDAGDASGADAADASGAE